MNLGNKANNLNKLQKLKYNVPNFSVVSYEDYSEYIDYTTILNMYNEIDFNNYQSIEQASINMKKFIEKSLNHFTYETDFKNCSVRSSCLVEDSGNASFAGQFSTYLNISSEKVKTYILKVISSSFDVNVLKYINENNTDIKQVKMNVIIQEMIIPDKSGIIFSSNPQGLLNETVIVIGNGLGDDIVSDKTDTTTYYYNKNDKLYYSTSTNDFHHLSNDMIQKLINLSTNLQNDFGEYIDIEFCLVDETVYILQVRSITTLNKGKTIVLDNSNIVESYPGTSTPLTIDFATYCYTSVFNGLIRNFVEISKDDIKKISSNMVTSNNGKMYYIISNWYEILTLLPFQKRIIPIWQEMLGVQNKSYNISKIKLNIFKKIKRNFKILYYIFSANKLMNKLNNQFDEIYIYFNDTYKPQMSNKELFEIYDTLETLLNNWYITLINDMYTFIFTSALKKSLKFFKVSNYETIYNSMLRNGDLESMKPILTLNNIVQYILDNNLLDELKSVENTNKYLSENDTKLKEKINDYIKDYGDRYIAELKLENDTFRSNNNLLIKTLINYCENPVEINDENNLNLPKISGIKKFFINFFKKRALQGINHREISRLNRTRIFGMVRTIYTDIGRNLYNDNLISSEKDIFYHTQKEIRNNSFCKSTIEKRKQDFKIFEQIPTYSRLIFNDKVFNKYHNNINNKKFTQNNKYHYGVASSSGIVEGEVYVVEKIDQNYLPQNKILVTESTDPGWVFLISQSLGIISEKGSLLSHTAIISRELKIPAVVGVANIVSELKTGDYVRLDGDNGIIELLEEKNV